MKNGDPHSVILLGKLTLAAIDWCVRPMTLLRLDPLTRIHFSIGQTPWLMDVLWRVPVTKWMRTFEAEAQEMVRARVKAQDFPHFRDLASYWVSRSPPSATVATEN